MTSPSIHTSDTAGLRSVGRRQIHNSDLFDPRYRGRRPGTDGSGGARGVVPKLHGQRLHIGDPGDHEEQAPRRKLPWSASRDTIRLGEGLKLTSHAA